MASLKNTYNRRDFIFDPYAANRTFAYMVTDIVPMLLKPGFSMEEINTFLVGNPRQFFSP